MEPNSLSSSIVKKRRTSEGAIDQSQTTTTCCGDNVLQLQQLLRQNMSQMERMEQLMNRMEDRLSHVDQLERRCEELERKLSESNKIISSSSSSSSNSSSIENAVTTAVEKGMHKMEQRLEDIIKSKSARSDAALDYHEMLMKNQWWQYSVPLVPSNYWIDRGVDEEYANGLADWVVQLKDVTTKMRRGGCKEGVSLTAKRNPHGILLHDDMFDPHWGEFCDALDQYNLTLDTLPDSALIPFELRDIQLTENVLENLAIVLYDKRFKGYIFDNNQLDSTGITTAILLLKENAKLESFYLMTNPMDREDAQSLCETVHRHPSLSKLTLSNCCDGYGFDVMGWLMNESCKLREIDLSSNGIITHGNTNLSDFLAMNPCLKALELSDNGLNDYDVVNIATALKTNTNLRDLELERNVITNDDALQETLFDDTSLGSAAGSNHTCRINSRRRRSLYAINHNPDPKINRRRKIFNVLAARNKTKSNIQHFEEMSPKLLPNILESTQTYGLDDSFLLRHNSVYQHNSDVDALSVVYEVMRKWDEVFVVYESLGGSMKG